MEAHLLDRGTTKGSLNACLWRIKTAKRRTKLKKTKLAEDSCGIENITNVLWIIVYYLLKTIQYHNPFVLLLQKIN